jgi:hypothetical protein
VRTSDYTQDPASQEHSHTIEPLQVVGFSLATAIAIFPIPEKLAPIR